MEFLKSLTFVLWNIALGLVILYSVKWLLFNPKQRRFLGKRVPLTPGFFIRKRDWIFNKVRDVLQDYLDQANDLLNKSGYLAKWETMVFDEVFRRTKFIDAWKLMPRKWKEKLRDHIAQAGQNVARRILRKIIPDLVAKYRLEYRIDDFDEQFSAQVIYSYFRRYVYRYLRYFVIGINLLFGISNMIWYLILLIF
ncbi:MAG: hypothetical protein FJ042_02330 [Candidatus Cloacimonetes bacterium]|nr:hypothetical protein [Candidatus Cloacimonadota bacterium]